MRLTRAYFELAFMAQYQWGLFTTRQAEAWGVKRSQLSYMDSHGLLVRTRRGVYRCGGVPEDEFTAVRSDWLYLSNLRTSRGEPVVAIGETAAWLCGLAKRPGGFEFACRERLQSGSATVLVRRRRYTEDDIWPRHGIPCLHPIQLLREMAVAKYSVDELMYLVRRGRYSHEWLLRNFKRIGVHTHERVEPLLQEARRNDITEAYRTLSKLVPMTTQYLRDFWID